MDSFSVTHGASFPVPGAGFHPRARRSIPAGLVAAVLLAAVALVHPGPLAAQDLLLSGPPAGPETTAGDRTCRAAPSWLPTDVRLGASSQALDGRRALLGFSRRTGTPGGERTLLRVVDLVTGRPLVTTDLGGFGRVTDVWASHEGTRAWVAAEKGGRVLTVDSRTGKLLMVWEIGRTSAQSGAVSAEDRYLYVTNREAGTLTLIDRATVGARTVELGRGVESLDVWERGQRTVWVANRIQDELVAVSGRTGRILARMASGGRGPVHLRVRPGTDEIWVAHEESAELVVLDARDHQILDWISLPSAPGKVAFSADGSEAYVSLPTRNRIVLVDPASRELLGIRAPGTMPASLAVAGCLPLAPGACGPYPGEPWIGLNGLPVSWVEDQQIVAGGMCVRRVAPAENREVGTRAPRSAPLPDGSAPGRPPG